MKNRCVGYSMIEMLLVLVVGAAIFLLSIQQYWLFKQTANVQTVRANVDMIMMAMARYYRANCYGTTKTMTPSYTVKPGVLNPLHAPPPRGLQVINISTTLVTPKYLNNLPLPTSPIVDVTAGQNGYIAQYNQYQNGTQYTYTAQVSILLLPNEQAQAKVWKKELGADCLSRPGSVALLGIQPCQQVVCKNFPPNKKCNYLVWERLPSLPTLNGNSNFWSIMPVVKSFANLYNTLGGNKLCGS